MKITTEMRVGVESMREPRGGRMVRCGLLPVGRGGRRDGRGSVGGLFAERLSGSPFPIPSRKVGERGSACSLPLLPLDLGGDVSVAPASLPPFRGRLPTSAYPGLHPGLSPGRPFGALELAMAPLPYLPT